MITLEQAKNLYPGQILYHDIDRNADGTPRRWKVNGQPKTWKRSPERVKVPLKHGLYCYDYLTEDSLDLVWLTEDEAMEQQVTYKSKRHDEPSQAEIEQMYLDQGLGHILEQEPKAEPRSK